MSADGVGGMGEFDIFINIDGACACALLTNKRDDDSDKEDVALTVFFEFFFRPRLYNVAFIETLMPSSN